MSEKSALPSVSPGSLMLAVMAAVGGVAVFGGHPKDGTPAPPPAAAVAPAKPADSTEPDPLVVLKEYFPLLPGNKSVDKAEDGVKVEWQPGSLAVTVTPEKGKRPAADLILPPDQKITYEFLICTVPDPVDTKLAFTFDAAVDAIGRAYQSRRFVLQATWLPWKREPAGKEPTDDTHRRYPGVLLFRKIVPDTVTTAALAVVCLVGESPQSGLSPRALTKALECYDQLARAVGAPPYHMGRVEPPPTDPLKIVGPYYSGTQGALKDTLAEWQRAHGPPHLWPRFELVSGTATAVNPTKYFPSEWPLLQASAVAGGMCHPTVLPLPDTSFFSPDGLIWRTWGWYTATGNVVAGVQLSGHLYPLGTAHQRRVRLPERPAGCEDDPPYQR